MTLCILKCFIEFYVFVLDEIDVEDPNFYTNVFALEMSEKTSPRTNQGSLRKDPSQEPKVF